MEEKKSPKANLEKSKSLSILMGLIVALSIVFVSFEWGTHPKVESLAMYMIPDIEFVEEIEITRPEEPTPPPPPPAPVVVEELNIVENETELEDVEIMSIEDNQLTAQYETYAPTAIIDSEEENSDHIFEVVEEMPEFPGGNNELLKFISRTVKYPVVAQENGVQGRVVCSFTVNQDGSVVDANVIRGIDPSLDKEALRVIGVMPKWKPGKQRGKPVRVRYTLPVVFKLQ